MVIKINKPTIFYLVSYISALLNGIIGPVFIIYLLSINLNLWQIGILLAIQRIAIIIFEFPTGFFADKYGRYRSVLFSFFLFSLGYFLWFFTVDFFNLLALSILLGVAFTFQSGAKESFMIDALHLSENDRKRDLIFSRIAIWANIGLVNGGFLTAGIVLYDFKFIWLVASLSNVALFLIYLFLKESKEKNNFIKEQKKLLQIKSIFSKTCLYPFFLITIFFSLASAIYTFIYPIAFKEFFQLPDQIFGLLGSTAALTGIISVFIIQKIRQKISYYYTLMSISTLLLIFYALFHFSKEANLFFLITIFIFIEALLSVWYPIYQSFFNKFISNNIRTSILSIASIFSLIAIALGEFFSGWIIAFFPLQNVVAYSGFLFILIIFFLNIINSKNKKTPIIGVE